VDDDPKNHTGRFALFLLGSIRARFGTVEARGVAFGGLVRIVIDFVSVTVRTEKLS